MDPDICFSSNNYYNANIAIYIYIA